MRVRGVLDILFGATLCAWVAIPSRADAQLLQPSAPQEPPTFAYELDLAVQKELPPVAVPPGQRVDVAFVHAGLPSKYRVTVDETGLAIPHPGSPRDLPARVSPGIVKPPPNCGAAVAPHWAALLEQRDETQVQRSIDALQAAAGGPPCSDMLSLVVRPTRIPLNNPRLVQTGRQLRVTVERLGVDGQTPERKWTVLFTAGRADFGWEYPTEQAFVAAAVLQDLADLAAFAGGAAPAASARVKVTLPALDAPDRFHFDAPAAGTSVAGDLAVAPHVWAPELYADAARRLLASRKLHAAADGPGNPTFLADLAELKAPLLLREARRVGERLTRAPLDAHAHEEAAFLWGAFALRESTGRYSDRRLTLARATAHLAFAGALRAGKPPSREGAWAGVLVSTLTGRAAEAGERMDALGAPAVAERPWMTALRLRNDGDWRKVDAPGTRTLVEQLEFVRAKTAAIDGLTALAALGDAALTPVPDWARILYSGGVGSIEEGRRFGRDAVALELRDLALAHGVSGDLTSDLPRAAGLLQRRQEPVVRRDKSVPAAIEVLGPGAWSASAARNVIEQVETRALFLERSLAVPKDAASYRDAVRPLVQSQPLFTMLESSWGPRFDFKPEACASFRSLVAKAPLELPAGLWAGPAEARCAQTSGLPPARSFFDPIVPRGTALDAPVRMVSGALGMGLSADQLEGFRRLSPLDSRLVFASLARQYRGQLPVEVVAQEYAPFAEYQISAARAALAALAKDPVAYRRMAEKMCALAADHCWTLGGILVAAGEDDAAAVVYQRAVDSGLDRVEASNYSHWLVTYYEERKQGERALAVASEAEQTWSHAGLAVMGRLLEGRGRLDEAEKRYLAIKERYENERPLWGFYVRSRQRPGGERWAAQADAAMKALFPAGLDILADVKPVPPAPNTGAVLTQPSKGLVAGGIRAGDTVVGLDGYVVRDGSHYGDVKALSIAPTMKLVVWHDGKYVEVEERRERINYFRQ